MRKRYSSARTFVAMLVAITVLIGAFFGCYFLVKNKYVKINNFIVKSTDVRGVDVSSYQGDVDMSKLKEQGISFVYVKATEGSSHTDEKFKQNWQNAKTAGLLSGAYHFFSFDSSGETQAQNYVAAVGDLRDHLIPAIDIEYHGDKKENPPEKSTVVKELKSYIKSIEEKYQVKPLLYMDNVIYEKYIKDDFSDYPRWMRSVYYPVEIEHHDGWTIWQYSDTGELNSHNGSEKYIDLDVLNGNLNLESLIVK